MDNGTSSIYVRTLGELSVSVDGRTVELPTSRKTRALLAYLALSPHPQRRDRLCEIFWEIPDDPRGSLRWSLSKIRKVLEADGNNIVLADRDSIRLDHSFFTVDVNYIEQLVGTNPNEAVTDNLIAAEQLFSGPFLSGLELDQCVEYKPWFTARRSSLEILQIKILSALAERHSEQPEQARRYISRLHALLPDDAAVKNRLDVINKLITRKAVSLQHRKYPNPERRAKGVMEYKKQSIVVLPFNNFDADLGHEYFADGVTEEIITALSRIRWLFVIARNTSYYYKGRSVNVTQLAKELGVRYVLEGSVKRAGNRIRITAQLIDGESGRHIWAERYDTQLEDVFAVQDEITEKIAGALEPQMVAAEHSRLRNRPEKDFDAWDFTIRAIALCREFTDEGSVSALGFLESALKIDPSYARALSQKAWVLCWRIHQGWENAEETLPCAERSAEKAVYSDPDEPWAHIAWLFIATIRKDGELLLSSAHRAVEANPNFAMAHSWLGASYALTGQGEKSLEWIEKARRLSPRDLFREEFDVHTCFAYFQTGDYEKAIEYAAKASVPRPDHVYPLLIRSASRAHLGQTDLAKHDLARILALSPKYSLEIARITCVFIESSDIDRFVEGLKLAGLT